MTKEVNKNRWIYPWSIFKRGYSEGTYPMNVFEFVLILSNTLLLLKIGQVGFAEVFIGVLLIIILSMYSLGRWNFKENNKNSIYRQDMLADLNCQTAYGCYRDIMIRLGGMDESIDKISFWMKEPLQDARKRILGTKN
jgi:K+ transporter